MDAMCRILLAVFCLLNCQQTISGLRCGGSYSYTICGDDSYCCNYDECCTTYYVYQLWWFWFIWIVIFLLIVSCIIAMRRRRNRLQYIRVAQPAYGTTVATSTTANYPQVYPYQPTQATAPAYPPQYAQKPPPYQ